ncbi:MAG: flippase-like domain-containing protein [Candidatus Latescibacterota bacterium]|nr:MAG: flippase-like domain-containing protein [Candidatus Latescibacterota bacterium]
MKKWVSLILPFIGLAIFVWIVSGTGVHKIIDTFRELDPKKLLIFPVFTAFFFVIRGYRWWVLLRLVGIDYSRWRSSVVWSIGFFGAAVTPGKVGDAIRAFYVSRETGRTFGECFVTIFIDRLMDLITIVVAGVVTLLIFSYYYIHIPSVWIFVVIAIVFLGLIYLLLHRDLMKKLAGPVFKFLTPAKYREQLTAQVHGFYDSLAEYPRRWRETLFAFALALAFWVVVVGLAITVTLVLEIDVPLGYVVLMMPAITLVEIIPISVSGLGTREAAVIFFFSVVGIGSAQAIGFSITYLLVGTYLTALVGFIAWLSNPAKLRQ